MASRMLQPLRLGRPLPCGSLCRVSAPGRPSPARLPAVVVLPEPARAPGARAFSSAGPAYHAKSAAALPKERRQIDKRKVVLSWRPPGRPVKLLFKNGGAARKAYEDYSSRAATVLGQPVAATKPRHGVKPFGWTMLLHGVPDAATRENIMAGLGPETRPHNVEVGEKMPEADVEEMVGGLKEKVADFGPLQTWQYSLSTSRRTRAGAVFKYPASADEAAKALHGQRIRFKNGTHARLAANVRVCIRLRIPVTQYQATRASVQEAMVSWKQKHVDFVASPHTDNHMVYSLISNDDHYQTLLDAAEALENILDGHRS